MRLAQVVGALNRHGSYAVGLSGEDAGLITVGLGAGRHHIPLPDMPIGMDSPRIAPFVLLATGTVLDDTQTGETPPNPTPPFQ